MNLLRRKRAMWILGGLIVLALLGGTVRGTVTARLADRASRMGDAPTFEVRQGPLTVSVSVKGTIKAREQEVIKCEVEGQTAILSIVPEGEHVKEGDLLIELDASQLQDAQIDQEIRVQNAEATFIGATEQLAVTENQAESDIDKAKLALQFADEDLKNFIGGEFPKQLKELEAQLTLSLGTSKRTEDEVEGSRRLAEKGFITQSELEADEQAALKAKLDLELAGDEKNLLTDFTYKRQLAQLESDVRQARMALERTERKASADIVQAKADLKAKESEYNREDSKLEKLGQQIEKATIHAPADGLVVYATSGRGGYRGNAEPLDEGQMVRERQELIHLPTGTSFMAEVDVHEASLTKITQGLPVHITVDALPGKSFQGNVVTVAQLPDAQSMWLNPDLKEYNTDIYIEGDTEGLRTGMSCLAEIIVEEHSDAVYVPVQAVVRERGKPTVYVVNGKEGEPREVELGLDNNRMVHIAKGLTAGEHVMLAPPLAARIEEEEGRENGRTVAKTEEDGETAGPGRGDAEGRPAGEEGMGRRRGGERGEGARERPQNASSEQQGAGGDMRQQYQRYLNASPEEKEKMRKEFEEQTKNLTPEQRQQMMRQMGGGGGGRRSGDASGAN